MEVSLERLDDPSLSNLPDLKKSPTAPKDQDRKFHTAVCYLFLGQLTVGLLCGFVAMMAFVFTQKADVLTAVEKSPVYLTIFQVLALMQFVAWMLEVAFILCYAEKAWMIGFVGVLIIVGGSVSAVTLYFFLWVA